MPGSNPSGRGGSARAGVREVAERAGVSVATVSRVLNNSPHVSPEARSRIQVAMEELNYVRDGAARSLTSRRSQSIGVIVPVLGTAVYAQAVEAIERRLQLDQYQLLIGCNGYDLQREYDLARAFVEQGVDGLVVVGSNHAPALLSLLERAGIPVVQTFVSDPKSALPCVGFDNYAPVYELTRYLANLGHRRFAVLHSHLKNNDRISARFDAIMAALADRGITPVPELVQEVGYTIADGRAGLRGLLATGHDFTALATTGDVISVGALMEAKALGIPVPERFSVTGFHDYELAAHVDPPLTTVHAPVAEMGVAAAQYLLSRLRGANPPRHYELPTSMVVRRSVGPPRPVTGQA